MEIIKNLQKHGNSKCIVIDSWILKRLGIVRKFKMIIEDPRRIIIERVDEEIDYYEPKREVGKDGK